MSSEDDVCSDDEDEEASPEYLPHFDYSPQLICALQFDEAELDALLPEQILSLTALNEVGAEVDAEEAASGTAGIDPTEIEEVFGKHGLMDKVLGLSSRVHRAA